MGRSSHFHFDGKWKDLSLVSLRPRSTDCIMAATDSLSLLANEVILTPRSLTSGDWEGPCPKKKMKMVRNNRPCVANGSGARKNISEADQKFPAILFVLKDFSPFVTSGNNMMQRPRRI